MATNPDPTQAEMDLLMSDAEKTAKKLQMLDEFRENHPAWKAYCRYELLIQSDDDLRGYDDEGMEALKAYLDNRISDEFYTRFRSQNGHD